MKVAIVCDWLTEVGGAERVVLALHQMYPKAPIYTSQYRPRRIDWFLDADVRTGWMNWVPHFLRKLVPFLRVWYFSHLDLSEYDLVISSTGAEAKGVKVREDAVHVSYMHAPTQYYWGLYDQYMKEPGFGFFDPVARLGLKLLVKPLRKWDYKAAQKPTVVVANSTYVQKDIKKYYGREAVVVFPPVDIECCKDYNSKKRSGFIITNRQVPWKKVDLAVQACMELGENLVVVGGGSEHKKLVKMAEGADKIKFVPITKEKEEIFRMLTEAKGYLFPGFDPFGISPLEALACGTPVVAYGAGGALDYVVDGKNGLLFKPQTAEALKKVIRKFNKTKFDRGFIRKSAQRFSAEEFKQQMKVVIKKAI